VRSASGDTSFIDLFDMCHGMTYTMMDGVGRHSNEKVDRDTVQAWARAGLPLTKLTLGLPFFGVKSGADARSYAELVAREPQLLSDPTLDNTQDGFFLVNGHTLSEKVRFAEREGLAGVMIWELGQDVLEDRGSLLWHVWDAAMRAQNKGVLHSLFGIVLTEDHMFGLLTFLSGGYYLFQTMARASRQSRDTRQAAKQPEASVPEGASDAAPGEETEKKES